MSERWQWWICGCCKRTLKMPAEWDASRIACPYSAELLVLPVIPDKFNPRPVSLRLPGPPEGV